MLRVSGKCLRVEERSGTKLNEATGELRPWAFDVCRILVADSDVVEVTRWANSPVCQPGRGDYVDWLVDVSARGGRLNVALDSEWPSDL